MSLLNYNASFFAAASPPSTNFYQQFQDNILQYQPPVLQQHPPQPQPKPQNQPQPYSYPTPQHPFRGEDQPRHQSKPPTFTKVTAGVNGGTTRVHAVVDYDDGDYYEESDYAPHPPVTPIQGPILIKNGSVPVVPLYSYPVLNNGTFVQIPILWTALSIALGVELRGEYIRGVPCIKKHEQLFCPTAGNSYPLQRIEVFIDENKALMRRMYGDFTLSPEFEGPGPGGGGGIKGKKNSKPGVPDLHSPPGTDGHLREADSYFSHFSKRTRRQSFRSNQSSKNERMDACESKVEIVTPYWASNSAGKIRAIVNTQHFEQAIHQEVCAKALTKRCSDDCGCEQKYKWHRLLAYDPDNDCKGIFMDWFLFPSCCVCRCSPL